MTALLQQPTVPGKVDGIISLDPPTLQCRDCGQVWTDEGRGIALTVLLSGCDGWGFCRRCGRDGVRRCGPCNTAHQAKCGEAVA